MPTMHVSKSVTIQKPVADIFKTLNNFYEWRVWSPWLIQEPEAQSNVAEDGKFHSWEGKRIGTGHMRIIHEQENEFIEYDLTFLKPWKSTAKVKFVLSDQANSTKVTWLMDSKLPFFMFWMKKMMEAWVGMDYARGLAMLKDYVEDGEVHSKLDFKSPSEFNGYQYIGINTKTSIDKIADSMSTDFVHLSDYVIKNQENIAGYTFSIYHKWDMVKRTVEYTAGIPVKEVPKNLSKGMVTGEIPSTRVHSIKHIGPYEHLGNAWSTLYSMQQNKVFKANKKIHPFEIYINDPSKVSPHELETEVCFAIK